MLYILFFLVTTHNFSPCSFISLYFFYLSQQHLFCCLLHASSTFENYWRLVFGLVYPGQLGIMHKWLRLGVVGCRPTAWSCGVAVLTQLVLYWMQLSRLIPLGVTNVQVPKVSCQFNISRATWHHETIGETWCLSCCPTAWSWGVVCYLMWLVLINVPDLWTMLFCRPCQFRRYHPSTQSANPSATSVSSVTSDNLSVSFSQSDNPSDTSAASNNPSISFVPSDNPSVSFAPSYDPPVSSAPLSGNPAALVNCNMIEPTRCAPGTASLYLPVERLLTLPGRQAFTQ